MSNEDRRKPGEAGRRALDTVSKKVTRSIRADSGFITADDKSAVLQRLVIGFHAGPCEEGFEFMNANFSFQQGDLFTHLFDAIVYCGAEEFVGGRKIPGAKGLKLWIVDLAAEKDIGGRLAHAKVPNVPHERTEPESRSDAGEGPPRCGG